MVDLQRFFYIILENFYTEIERWSLNNQQYKKEKVSEALKLIERLEVMKTSLKTLVEDKKIKIDVPEDFTFEKFDEIKEQEKQSRMSITPDVAFDTSKVGELERIFGAIFEQIKSKFEDEEFNSIFGNLYEEFQQFRQEKSHWYHEAINYARIDSMENIRFLSNVVYYINPKPIGKKDIQENLLTLLQESHHFGWARTIAFAPISRYSDYNPNNMNKTQMLKLVDAIKERVKRLSYDLERELALSSYISQVVLRFKQRAEWYDFRKLQKIANEIDENRQYRKAEENLTMEMCKFLFDNGLTPIYRLTVGENEIDVLQPDSSMVNPLIIEAKVYSESRKQYLIDGIKQLHSYLQRTASEYNLSSAYYVVFRMGGPQYSFQSIIKIGNYIIYPILIDIAPAAESGQRTGRIIEITEDEILIPDVASEDEK